MKKGGRICVFFFVGLRYTELLSVPLDFVLLGEVRHTAFDKGRQAGDHYSPSNTDATV